MRNKTGLIFFPAFDWAISPTHPEREERLLYTRDQIFEEGVMDLPQIKEYKPRLATLHDIARVHFCVPRVQSQVKEAHLIAAGSALHLGDCVINGEIKNGFALVRPPGHHAMRVVHGNRGFCNINNEAVLVDYLRRRHGVKRVAIVDSDVHHGDGTQDIFFHDPDVLFISFHQDGRTIFPGTGFTHELGGPKAYARTLNIPLAPGCTDEVFMYVAEQFVLPVINDFAPDFIINSAGQDNHFTDPLGSMKFTSNGYAKFTEMLNPHLAVLEGGYAIESALPYVNLAIILALAGIDYGNIKEYTFLPGKSLESPDRMERVKNMVEQLLDIWANRDRFDVEKAFGDNKFYQRRKSIYYDTDYIEEEQYERLYKCPDCPGYLSFDSSGNYGFAKSTRVFAVSIPFTACSACQVSAYDIYEEAKGNKKFSFVYMQDKSTDTCITFDRAVKQEWTSEG